MLLTAAFSEFTLALEADGRKDHTIAWYKEMLVNCSYSLIPYLQAHHIKTFSDVQTKALREYIAWLKQSARTRKGTPLSEHTVKCLIRASHRFFKWSAEEYEISNPMKRIAFPKETQSDPKAISLEDIQKMLATCDESPLGKRNRAIILMLMDTGCRAGGLVGLQLDHIDFDQRRLLVTEKGDRTRAVPFSEITCEAFDKWVGVRLPQSRFFYNYETGDPLTVSGLRHILKNIGRRAKVKGRVNTHAFRHFFAREYIFSDGDLGTLSKLLGHRNVNTTVSNYAVFTDKELGEKHARHSPVNLLNQKPPPKGVKGTKGG